jgi:putative ABC transport system permease protein
MSHVGARRLYRLLLLAWPRAHRARYGEEMEASFLALLRRDGERHGPAGALLCWVGATWDALRHGIAARYTTSNDKSAQGGERMGTLLSDLRYATRALIRRPVFTATAVGTLALGIGANAAVFTVVSGFLFTPLPYGHPEELVTLRTANPELGWNNTDVGPADAWDWRARTRTLKDVAVFYNDGLNLTGGGEPELVEGIRTSPNIFDLLGRAPVVGRGFTDDEFGPDHRVAILADGFWERRFGRDAAVLGSVLDLDGNPFTIVGVLPPDFRFLDSRPDVFIPLTEHPDRAERGGHYADALGRMSEGATVDEVREDLNAIAAQLGEEYPEHNRGWIVEVTSTHTDLVGDVAMRASGVLLVSVLFVLLMACVNVANLVLARGEGRTRELAVRTALGASRARVLSQLLSESLVLALLGGALGLALANVAYRAIVSALPTSIPPVFQWQMDGKVLAFVAAVTLGSALIFGLVPALRASGDAASDLREGGRGGRSRRSGRMGSTLVVAQTALAVVLLVGGGLLMKSLAAMRHQDFGFDPENVVVARIALPHSTYDTDDKVRAFWDAVEGRVRDLPGVTNAGSTQSHPLMGSNWGNTIRVTGSEDVERKVRSTYLSAGLFGALRFRIVQGRGIDERDGPDAPPVAVVNEAFVQQFLSPGEDPLGQSILTGDPEAPSFPIVGVVHNVVERSVDTAPEPSVYVSLAQQVVATRSLVVRTATTPGELVPAIQKAVWSVDPDIPLYGIDTMSALVRRRLGGFAVIGYLMATFAVLSLILGAVGIYGVTAYAAGQRTGEIGVRMALGAEGRDVVRMVVTQGGRRALLGVLVGLAAAFGMARLLGSVLVGVSAGDPTIFASVALVLGAVSFLGLWLPARRAARVDPVRALGAE